MSNKNTRKVIKSPEYISKDILEEDFVRVFQVPFFVQMILGSCRVYLKARFITTPTLGQKMYTVFCMTFSSILYCIMTEVYASIYLNYTVVYYLFLSITAIDHLSFLANLIHVRFFNQETNTELFITMQKIDRHMKIDHNCTLNNIVARVNTVTVICVMIIHVLVVLSMFVLGEYTLLCLCGILYGQLMVMIEMANCANLLMFFLIRVRFVNAVIRNHVNPIDNILKPKFMKYFPTNKMMTYIASQTHDFAKNATDVYLKEIFKGFAMYKDVYRFQVCFFCIKLVVSSLLTFEFSLLAMQRNILYTKDLAYVTVHSTIGFLTTLYLCARCEVFFREIRETKRLSVAVLLKYQKGPLRDKAARILKLIEESPPEFSIYDMWHMDGYIFLKICSVVTSLIVTLIQFSFL